MAKSDPIERALDRLGELRHLDASEPVIEELRGFLRSHSNLVIAKAAKVACEMRISTLTPEMVATFEKLMTNAPRAGTSDGGARQRDRIEVFFGCLFAVIVTIGVFDLWAYWITGLSILVIW
jgi:hypothetical protein